MPLLYTSPWWLDATCGAGGWDTGIGYNAERKPVAALPYHFTRIRGLSALITPPFTQWVSLLSQDNVVEPITQSMALLSELPKTAILDLSLRPDADPPISNHFFPVALKYSYIIPSTTTPEKIRSGYNEGLRRNIKQAEKGYTVEQSTDIASFLSLCKQSYQQQKVKVPSWLDRVVPAVFNGLLSHQCGMLTIAKANGQIIAGVLTAWDSRTSYYLAGGRIADDHGASAHALLLDNAIHAAIKRDTLFDFEGSMHPGIANFFQSFGAVPQSYWNIRRFRGAGRLWSLLQK
jgi:hypothetical protein